MIRHLPPSQTRVQEKTAIGPAGQYETVSETMDDIFERVQADSTIENWLAGEITGTVLKIGRHISPDRCTNHRHPLQQRFGLNRFGRCLPPQRTDLRHKHHSWAREPSISFQRQKRYSWRFCALTGTAQYSGERQPKSWLQNDSTRRGYCLNRLEMMSHRNQGSVNHPGAYASETDTNATVYKFTAPPDFWLTGSNTVGSIVVEESHAAKRKRVDPGDAAILHSQTTNE